MQQHTPANCSVELPPLEVSRNRRFETDVAEPTEAHVGARVQRRPVLIHTNDFSGRSDHARQIQGNIADTAANVQYTHARGQARLFQQVARHFLDERADGFFRSWRLCYTCLASTFLLGTRDASASGRVCGSGEIGRHTILRGGAESMGFKSPFRTIPRAGCQ